MDDPFCYPVYFECPGLDSEQQKRIQSYFLIHRKSGGGECGPVKKQGEKLYSIAFKEPQAQQRVLEKSEHLLEFASGSLVLTVRSGPEPTSPISASTPKYPQSVTPPLVTPTPKQPPVDTTPTDEEYDLRPDPFVVRYLNECPKAWSDLQNDLNAVSCSAQIHPEEGRVSVRGLAQPAARNWKSAVDQLFDGYLCHYEVDAHKIKALLQFCCSNKATDEVKVYREDGITAVVGKHSQVKARMVDLEASTSKSQGSTVEQSSVYRLGEAKLQLLWEEINQSLGKDFPDVKVSQGESGQVVLKGSMEQMVKARDSITEMEIYVLEKTVSELSPHFLAFLRKAYGDPGVLRDFLGFGDEVEIELRETELHLFSFSSDKLDKAKLKIQKIFTEVKLDVPNWPALRSELGGKLKTKTNQLNLEQCRVQAVSISDSTVLLLGLTAEVTELSQTVSQLILDHSNIESKVILRFPELAENLPKLLQLHQFDYSGVVFHHVISPSGPMMVLEGPSSKVTDVGDRLNIFLDSLVQRKLIIDQPGAVRYFKSPSGREDFNSIAKHQKCLILLEEQPHTSTQTGEFCPKLNKDSCTVSSYSLNDGLQVLVCQGDITRLEADVLVNAANEDLDHCGGVAAALSKAGGPEVQKESKALVKQIGKIPTGEVVVTTGGNLKCKKLLHAVGPRGGTGGRERSLLETTVRSALEIAETMEFRSIAIPCISSGVFGVPIPVCSEAIVTAVKEFGRHGDRSLRKIILIDNREEVVEALQEACDRILQGKSYVGNQIGAAQNSPEDGVHVEIVQGTVETQQVDALVSPIVGHDPLSTHVGNDLHKLVGPQLNSRFYSEAGGATAAGDTVLVQGLPGLQSTAVIFLNLKVWDNNQHGQAVQVLREGVKKILASCETKGFTSLALPVLGTGAVLRFPHKVASRAILEEVKSFEQDRASRSPFLVRIIIHPNDKESSKAFQSAQESLHLRGFTNDTNPEKASFYRHVSDRNNEVTAMLGGVKLQLVSGDIIHESTDVIVNTTDFSKKHLGVSEAILAAAGPIVRTELAQAGTPRDHMCPTSPGLLGCSEIIHARFRCETDLFQLNCKNIVTRCENKGYRSVSFPAVNTGKAGMAPAKACKALLDGLGSAISDLKPKSLSLIRIVILQEPVFQAFKSELNNRFGLLVPCRPSLREKAKQKLKKMQEKRSQTSRSSGSGGKTLNSSRPHPAEFVVICVGRDTINTVQRDLEAVVQKQLIEREIELQDLFKLDEMELQAVLAKVKGFGLSLESRRRQIFESERGIMAGSTGAGAHSRTESEDGVFALKGVKEDVLSVIELINKSIQKTLSKDLQENKEALLALTVQWSIQDTNGVWQELSLGDNYKLEDAYQKNQVSEDIKALNEINLRVNLRAREATDWLTGFTYKVKRTETDTVLDLPPLWEPMQDEVFKKVEVQPNSEEYQSIAQGFLNTAKYNIVRIERVQNIYLWQAYSVCRQRIQAKNGPAELGERRLYHGTSAKSCECIEKDRFDRSYAGTNAAMYGKGVYFAIHADYSASRFSPPDPSGLKRMYVARVLTGRYTLGNSAMKAPPPRGSDPTDCFDSLVDNQQQPSMFVVFHDDQAYPEYLITFT